jgi:hypothetical protein
VVSGRFDELGATLAERLLAERRARLDAGDQPRGELRIAEGVRGAHELRQERGVVGLGADVGRLFEFGQPGSSLLWAAPGEQHLGRGRECHRA